MGTDCRCVFALMVVLTIFSRAASSAVKAHVSVVKASRQKISHEIQLDGSVEAKNYFLQYVPAGLMVTGVQISAGQQVEAGDVIFTVDVQKVQEKIKAIEAELNRADQKRPFIHFQIRSIVSGCDNKCRGRKGTCL
ncbi:MAG: biotin/lipoyl-binding protein [Eubacterium ramulus]